MTGILLPEQSDYLANIYPKENSFAEIKNFALLNKIPIVDEITMRFIMQLLKIKDPERVLEIGTATGYSSLKIAEIISEKSLLITVEKSPDNIILAKTNFAKYDFGNKIKLIEGEAKEIVKNLECGFDFIFLDADKHDYIELLSPLINLLTKGGIIVVDNLLWKGRVANIQQNEKAASVKILREFNLLFLNESKIISSI
ncbi:MAG: O-methyltransferase, partial [Ignavibacteriales bacterium CG_4_9_14_3_um_filter_34_10]